MGAFALAEKERFPFCVVARGASGGADNQANSRGSSLTDANGADCSRGGSSQTSVVRSKRMLCILAPRGVEFKFFPTVFVLLLALHERNRTTKQQRNFKKNLNYFECCGIID